MSTFYCIGCRREMDVRLRAESSRPGIESRCKPCALKHQEFMAMRLDQPKKYQKFNPDQHIRHVEYLDRIDAYD
jgi:hypothetical protein